jgi:hypothetical protein
MSEVSRRTALLRAMQALATVWVLPLWRGQAWAAEECVNPATDDIRRALEYTNPSPDPSKTCSGCGFFTMGKPPCGECLLVKGAVSSHGHCHSWSDRNG